MAWRAKHKKLSVLDPGSQLIPPMKDFLNGVSSEYSIIGGIS